MKIGILTLPFNNNFGGYLQSYALMTILKNEGYNVELIYRRHNRRPLSARTKYFIKSLIKLSIGCKPDSIIMDQECDLRRKGINMMPFVDSKISPKTRPLYSTKELIQECSHKYDAIIVGSDQVWRPEYVPNVENFFLDFVKLTNVRRIAYAASFGERHPRYSNAQRKECGKLIRNFDFIGLREDSGAEIIKEFGWTVSSNPQVVLDPTMLLPKQHYESLIRQNNAIDEKGYLLTYLLDESKDAEQIVSTAISKLGLHERQIIDSGRWKSKDYTMPSIESWLASIRYADFAITDSFHGVVFCIIFNVPFAVYINNNRGSDRFYSLLKRFGLESRIVNNKQSLLFAINGRINWERINVLLNQEVHRSIRLLKEGIGKNI